MVPKEANQLYVLDADEPRARANSEASAGGCDDSESSSNSIMIELTLAASWRRRSVGHVLGSATAFF